MIATRWVTSLAGTGFTPVGIIDLARPHTPLIAQVHPREVVKQALQLNAAAVIAAHNHPSGEATPSQADKAITLTLQHALATVGITLLDHLILGSDDMVSLAEEGLITNSG